MQQKLLRTLAVLAGAWISLTTAADAGAQGLRPSGYFVQGGIGPDHVWNAGVGVAWPWSWKTTLLGTEVGGLTEAYISRWDARAVTGGGRRGFTQFGVVPLLRVRFSEGRSPWFIEGGIGISGMDHHFVTPTKQFTTSFNFVDVLGAGLSLGSDRRQEISVRLQHVSNAGIRVPNPGQNLLQLHYATSF